jgi:anti-sigma regulatory factor (Ser/Thr protein kinase)
MDMTSQSVRIEDATQVGEARRAAATLATGLGFGETAAGRVALVVTEAGTNLVKHARGGEVCLRAVTDAHDTAGLEVLALDRGPGMRDIAACLSDGYSTTGSAGTGLGAIARAATEFDIYSAAQKGTVLLARVFNGHAGRPELFTDGTRVGGICVAHTGEEVAGDSWSTVSRPGYVSTLIADGLGHGAAAAEAASRAVRLFRTHYERGPAAVMAILHDALRSTRGAAVAVAEYAEDTGVLRFCGIGNISGAVISPVETRHLMSHNGTVGHEIRRIQEFTYAWPAKGVLVLHSDGLSTHWGLESYPGVLTRDPSVIAGVLYRDFKRGRDDATVVVARH